MTSQLKSEHTKSCGCLVGDSAKLRFTTHGATVGGKQCAPPSKPYIVWNAMKQRCINPNNKNYKHYGAKGITVCNRWLDFSKFLADMGEPQGLMLERRNNDLGYCPENCYWSNRKTQLDNRSVTIWVQMPDGRIQTASDAYRELGCTKSMFFRKIKHLDGFMGCVRVENK
jgi:hypothetical protein